MDSKMKVSHQRSDALPGHGHVRAHMRLGWQNPLMFVLSELSINTKHNILSHVMVTRIMQLFFDM